MKNYYLIQRRNKPSFNFLMNLPVLPNSERSGEPNPSNTKIYLSNIEYNLLNKHVAYSDMHMGAEHPILGNKDDKNYYKISLWDPSKGAPFDHRGPTLLLLAVVLLWVLWFSPTIPPLG